MGTETWFNKNITSCEMFPKGYNIVQKDRHDGYGGVVLALKTNIDFSELEVINCKAVFAKSKSDWSSSIIVETVYRTPNSNLDYAEIYMCLQIENIVNASKNSVLFIGDLNLLDIDYKTTPLRDIRTQNSKPAIPRYDQRV